MLISIWDKLNKKWIPRMNIKNIYQCREYFETNFDSRSKKWNTDRYELTFIHADQLKYAVYRKSLQRS